MREKLEEKSIRKSGLYSTWRWMRQRCRDKNAANYRRYWAKWIKVCKEWQESFEVFYNDMIDSHKPWLELDRIDNLKDYCKDNCRWATRKQQNNHASSNHKITYKWRTQNMSQWAGELWIHYDLIRWRLKRWWSVTNTFEIPTLKWISKEFYLTNNQ